MFKLHPLSLSVKFAATFFGICVFLLVVMMAVVIPKLEKERFLQEAQTIERLLEKMEHQVRLTVQMNILYNTSNWEKIDLTIRNKFYLFLERAAQENTKPEAFPALMEAVFGSFTCNALLFHNKEVIYSTQEVSSSPLFASVASREWETWKSLDKTKSINICPKSTREHFIAKPIGETGYALGVQCESDVLLRYRTEFEKSIGAMLKQSFKSVKQDSKGFAYMMWVDGGMEPCDHDARYRKIPEASPSQFNARCCVSESSPTDQPLTGTLTPAEYLHAAQTKEPLHHLLEGKAAITWVRLFDSKREYPFVFAITLYEEDIYGALDPMVVKFIPAGLSALMAAFGLGWVFFRRFAGAVERLSWVARAVKSGDLRARSGIKGEDDVGVLAETFDRMMDALQENITTLDAKVAQRTQELECLLGEKEILLKEVHHRVKNNLAIIVGLMQLKEQNAKHKESKALLVELQERIYAIELLHRQLYQSRSLKQILFNEYLDGLIGNIRHLYHAESRCIGFELHAQAVELGIEQALACGLVVNECIINAVKHAFSKEGGWVRIEFKMCEGECFLAIKDNGKGLPEGTSLSSQSTLEMQLVQGIVAHQLGGRCVLKSENGTTLEVYFSYEKP